MLGKAGALITLAGFIAVGCAGGDPAEDLPAGGGLEGTIPYASGVLLTAAFPAAGTKRYTLTGLSPGASYEISISGVAANTWTDLTVAEDASFRAPLATGRSFGTGSAQPARFVSGAGGTAYLELSAAGATGATLSATMEAAPTLDATLAFPTDFPFTGPAVGPLRHYRIAGLVPGTAYTAAVGSNDGVAAYADGSYQRATCPTAASCGFIADAGGEGWLSVLDSGADGFTLDLSVRPAVTTAATLAYPADFVFRSTVGVRERLWYRVTGLAAGMWAFHLAGYPTIAVFRDAAGADRLGGGYLSLPTGGDVFVAVDGGPSGGSFELLVTPLPPAAPLAYAPGATRSSSVDGSYSVTSVTGLTPGGVYAVRLSGLVEDVDFQAFGDAQLTSLRCAWRSFGTAEAACTATASSSGQLYVVVSGVQYVGLPPYTLGTSTTPYALSLTPGASAYTPLQYASSVPWSGFNDDVHTSFLVSGLEPGFGYTVSGGPAWGLGIAAYADPGLTTLLCGSSSPENECELTAPASGALYVDLTVTPSPGGVHVGSLGLELRGTTVRTAVPLQDLPTSGRLDASWNVHEVTGLSAGTPYVASLTGISVYADLQVYADAELTQLLCDSMNAGTADESCSATPTSGSAWVVVTAALTPGIGDYTLDLQ